MIDESPLRALLQPSEEEAQAVQLQTQRADMGPLRGPLYSGAKGLQAGVQQFAGDVGELAFQKNPVTEGLHQWAGENAARAAAFAPDLGSLSDLDLTNPEAIVNFGLGLVGQGLPSIAAGLAGGVGGRVLMGARAAIPAMAATTFPMEAGETAMTIKDTARPLAERVGIAAGKGAINTGIEMLGGAPSQVLRRVGQTVGRRTVGGMVREGVADVGKAMTGEALTEGAQEVVGLAAHSVADPSRNTSHDIDQILTAMIGGGLLGGGLGAIPATANTALAALERPYQGVRGLADRLAQGDGHPSVRGASIDETLANIERSDAEGPELAAQILGDQSIPAEIRAKYAGADFSDPAVRAQLGAEVRGLHAGRAARDAVGSLVETLKGWTETKKDTKHSLAGGPNPLVGILSQYLKPELLQDEKIIEQLPTFSRLLLGAMSAPDPYRALRGIRALVNSDEASELFQDTGALLDGLTEYAQKLDLPLGKRAPESRQAEADVGKKGSMFERYLTPNARKLTFAASRRLARLIDDYNIHGFVGQPQGGREGEQSSDQQFQAAMKDAFGPAAQIVVDHYKSRHSVSKGVYDPQSVMEEADIMKEAAAEAASTAETAPDAGKLAEEETGGQDKPFTEGTVQAMHRYKDTLRKLPFEKGGAVRDRTLVENVIGRGAKPRATPFSKVVAERGDDPAGALRELLAAVNVRDVRDPDLKKAADNALKVWNETQDANRALDEFEVLSVEGYDQSPFEASDDDLKKMRTLYEAKRNAKGELPGGDPKESMIVFYRKPKAHEKVQEPKKLTLSAESMWRTWEKKHPGGQRDEEPKPDYIRRMFIEAFDAVLARDDMADANKDGRLNVDFPTHLMLDRETGTRLDARTQDDYEAKLTYEKSEEGGGIPRNKTAALIAEFWEISKQVKELNPAIGEGLDQTEYNDRRVALDNAYDQLLDLVRAMQIWSARLRRIETPDAEKAKAIAGAAQRLDDLTSKIQPLFERIDSALDRVESAYLGSGVVDVNDIGRNEREGVRHTEEDIVAFQGKGTALGDTGGAPSMTDKPKTVAVGKQGGDMGARHGKMAPFDIFTLTPAGRRLGVGAFTSGDLADQGGPGFGKAKRTPRSVQRATAQGGKTGPSVAPATRATARGPIKLAETPEEVSVLKNKALAARGGLTQAMRALESFIGPLKPGDMYRALGIQVDEAVLKAMEEPTAAPARAAAPAPADVTIESGGALGADTLWAQEAKKLGIKTNAHTFEGHNVKAGTPVKHSAEELAAADELLDTVNKKHLKRRFPSSKAFVDNLLRRNYYQVKDAEAVVAVTTFSDGKPEGGTAWAMYMAVEMDKPVYAFDQLNWRWKTWDGSKWVDSKLPPPYKNFAGVGTRDLNEKGLAAIREYLGQYGTLPKAEPKAEPKAARAVTEDTNDLVTSDPADLAPVAAAKAAAMPQIPMYYKMPVSALRPELQKLYPNGTTTAQLIIDGHRTATTRAPFSMKGQRFTIKGVAGKVFEVVGTEKVDLTTPEGSERWSKREGWSVEYADSFGRQVRTGAIQTIFKEVKAEPAPAKTALVPISKRTRTSGLNYRRMPDDWRAKKQELVDLEATISIADLYTRSQPDANFDKEDMQKLSEWAGKTSEFLKAVAWLIEDMDQSSHLDDLRSQLNTIQRNARDLAGAEPKTPHSSIALDRILTPTYTTALLDDVLPKATALHQLFDTGPDANEAIRDSIKNLANLLQRQASDLALLEPRRPWGQGLMNPRAAEKLGSLVLGIMSSLPVSDAKTAQTLAEMYNALADLSSIPDQIDESRLEYIGKVVRKMLGENAGFGVVRGDYASSAFYDTYRGPNGEILNGVFVGADALHAGVRFILSHELGHALFANMRALEDPAYNAAVEAVYREAIKRKDEIVGLMKKYRGEQGLDYITDNVEELAADMFALWYTGQLKFKHDGGIEAFFQTIKNFLNYLVTTLIPANKDGKHDELVVSGLFNAFTRGDLAATFDKFNTSPTARERAQARYFTDAGGANFLSETLRPDTIMKGAGVADRMAVETVISYLTRKINSANAAGVMTDQQGDDLYQYNVDQMHKVNELAYDAQKDKDPAKLKQAIELAASVYARNSVLTERDTAGGSDTTQYFSQPGEKEMTDAFSQKLSDTLQQHGFRMTDEVRQYGDAIASKMLASPTKDKTAFLHQAAGALSYLVTAHKDFQGLKDEVYKHAGAERIRVASVLMSKHGMKRGDALVHSYRHVVARALRDELIGRADDSLIAAIKRIAMKALEAIGLVKTDAFQKSIAGIVDNAMAGKYNRKPEGGLQKLSFQAAIDFDKHAADVLSAVVAGNKNLALTGSITLSKYGPVYRANPAALHDLDIVVMDEKKVAAVEKDLQSQFPGATMFNQFDWKGKSVHMWLVPPKGARVENLEFKGKKLVAYSVMRGNKEVGWMKHDDGHEIKNGETAVLMDLFIHDQGTAHLKLDKISYEHNGNKRTVNVLTPAHTFGAKLEMSRSKDLNDYILFNPGAGTKYNAQRPGLAPMTDAQIAEAKAELLKLRGDKIKLEIDKSGLFEGSYDYHRGTGERLMKLAFNSLHPLETIWHESVHDFMAMLLKDGRNDIRKALVDAVNRPDVANRVRAILKDHPDALKSLDGRDGEEEMLAYAFQFWAAGQLKLTGDAQNVFQKIAKFIRELLGILTEAEKTEAIFAALKSGKLADPSTAAAALDTKRLETAEDRVVRFAGPVKNVADKLLQTAVDRLTDSGIQNFKTIADMFHQSVGREKGELPFLPRRSQQLGKWRNRLFKALANTTAEQRADAAVALQSGGEAKTAEGAKIAAMMREMLDDLYAYLSRAGVADLRQYDDVDAEGNPTRPWRWERIKEVKNYFPRAWDPESIRQNRDAFLTLFAKHVGQAEALEAYEALANSDGQIELAENEHHVGFSPYMQAVRARGFPFINAKNAAEFQPFMQKDLTKIMSTYLYQAVHRAEYTRSFGNNGEVIRDLIENATVSQGATMQQAADAALVVRALEGTLGHDMNPSLKRAFSTAIVYENIVLLPFAIFASLVDPLGIAVRTGDLKEAFIAFKEGIKGIFDALTGKEGQDMQTELARLMGVIDERNMLENMGDVYNGVYMSAFLQKLNNTFFKWNGMELWNRRMRVAALAAGQRFVLKNKDNKRYMKELGLEGKDHYVASMPDGTLATTVDDFKALGLEQKQAETYAAAVQEALFRFVDSTILRPSAAQRPVWGSDPMYMLIFHLKQFTFSFQQVIMKRAMNEMAHGNAQPMWMLASYVPFMIAADMLKGGVTGARGSWDLIDWITNGVDRSGVLGRGVFAADAVGDAARNSVPGASFLGPTIGHAMDLLQTVAGSDRDSVGKLLMRSVPASPLVKAVAG